MSRLSTNEKKFSLMAGTIISSFQLDIDYRYDYVTNKIKIYFNIYLYLILIKV